MYLLQPMCQSSNSQHQFTLLSIQSSNSQHQFTLLSIHSHQTVNVHSQCHCVYQTGNVYHDVANMFIKLSTSIHNVATAFIKQPTSTHNATAFIKQPTSIYAASIDNHQQKNKNKIPSMHNVAAVSIRQQTLNVPSQCCCWLSSKSSYSQRAVKACPNTVNAGERRVRPSGSDEMPPNKSYRLTPSNYSSCFNANHRSADLFSCPFMEWRQLRFWHFSQMGIEDIKLLFEEGGGGGRELYRCSQCVSALRQ